MKTKFTKGPWDIQPCHEGIEIYKEDLAIARVPITKDVREEAKANVRLITAAPDLLQALIEINSMIADSCTENGVVINIGKLAEITIRAINKAVE